MEKRRSISGGIIMILIGITFLLLNMFPGISEQLNISRHWPLLIVTVGLFFIGSALFNVSDLAIPGSIISGVGTILYYQNATGNWASWAFVWTLIPGFVGIGLLLSSALKGGQTGQAQSGLKLLGTSAILFIIFGLFFTGFGDFGRYWPIFLIIVGVWLLIKNRFSSAS